MNIIHTKIEGSTILTIRGNMDLEHHSEFTQAFKDAGSGDKPRVIINLTGVTSLSSSGCGAMVNFSREISSRGGTVILSALSKTCVEVLNLLSLSDFFVITQTDTEAISRMRQLGS